MLWSLLAARLLCCGIFAPAITFALSLVLYVFGSVTINILLDEWDRTATRKSHLLTATATAADSALADQDQAKFLAQPSDFERWSKFSIAVTISPKKHSLKSSLRHKPFHRTRCTDLLTVAAHALTTYNKHSDGTWSRTPPSRTTATSWPCCTFPKKWFTSLSLSLAL